jgi:hypothetical protein
MNLRTALKQLVLKQMLKPQIADNADYAGNTPIDTLGLSSVLVVIQVGAIDIATGSTAETTPPLLEECDTSDGSYTAITGAALGTVIGASDDETLHGIFVDLTKTHKRYLRVQAPHSGDGSAGGNLAILGIGFPADQGPTTAAEMGLHELVSA